MRLTTGFISTSLGVVNRTALTFVALFAVLAGVAALTLAAGSPRSDRTAAGRLRVVAGENVYGSIAAQIGGRRVHVTSVLTDPNADPHLFEPGTSTGLTVTDAAVVIQNGLGYDAFMNRLEQSAPSSHRVVITIADALRVHGADVNPHLWYDVPRLPTIAAAIAGGLERADRAHAGAYRAGLRRFDASLGPLRAEVARIRAADGGAPVAYTEPVPGYLVSAAGLSNLAPDAFTRSIEEGTEPSPSAVAAMSSLIAQRRIRVLLYNPQAVSPITAEMRDAALRAGIPVVGMRETLPPGHDFQQWQLAQARALEAALAR
jgi:zinc/manganese transport system substrate-binding protein